MTRWGGQTRWEALEDWMIEHDEELRKANGDDRAYVDRPKGEPWFEFTAFDVAAELGVSTGEASALINSHVGAQRGARSQTLFVIKRKPGTRTRNAVWSAGERAADMKMLNQAVLSDIRVKIIDAWTPDVQRLAVLQPRLARKSAIQLLAVTDSALTILAAALDVANTDDGA